MNVFPPYRVIQIFCLSLIASIASSSAATNDSAEFNLITISNAPAIQMLVPGFVVRPLPLHLKNINCFAYAPDGRLFALGYNGNVYELKDTDGDGLEDTATLFFNNEHHEIPASIGMAWGPGGLYIASQGRILRLHETTNHTAVIETATSGWVKPTGAAGSGLDAVGLTVDKSGNVYFGLGCDDWMHAYRVDAKTGKSLYDLHSERGTIQKLSPDGHRTTIATGLRFTIGMAFNHLGDLFVTDQEGATWLPNGNPFDELLWIRPGRHYGFPPRHPVYLPGVIDEPSTFDYSPQHQSTCGLHFDEPVAPGKNIFGPQWWLHDALIAGESRGKIWRTKLVKTDTDYIAQNQIIACLNQLTVDAIPTPDGDLLVTCHGGQPDWGTGPQGYGNLYKISYRDAKAPQPVLFYAASPTEFHLNFDRPFETSNFPYLLSTAVIHSGKYVTAGERFETLHPGYQAVRDQQLFPRFNVPIQSAQLSADGREIILHTSPQTTALHYALQLPGTVSQAASNQDNSIDVATDLSGVAATWVPSSFPMQPSWTGWLPHLDLLVARELTSSSLEQQHLFSHLAEPGTLKLRAQLDLSSMLHPQVQPGAKLDFEYPPEQVTIQIRSSVDFQLRASSGSISRNSGTINISVVPTNGAWLALEIDLPTGKIIPDLQVDWFTDEDARPRPFPLHRILVPWAKPLSTDSLASPRLTPEIVGGDWARGQNLFGSEQLSCYKCHELDGFNGHIGPNLGNLRSRDYASVLKDILEPSAAINPDYLAFNVETKSGDAFSGVIISNTPAQVTLGLVSGTKLTLKRDEIASVNPSRLSLMPEGLLNPLNEQQKRDLFTFLLLPKP